MPSTEDTARYVGVADWWGPHVWVDRDGTRAALPACGDELIAGFAWGRRGIAARELARAILADATGSPAVAERFCRDFTHAVVAELPRTGFTLATTDVLEWLEAATAPACCRRASARTRRAGAAPRSPCPRASARGRGARRA